MSDSHERILSRLLDFIRDEQRASTARLLEIWERPLAEKLQTGWSQRFVRLARGEESETLWAWVGEGETRFRRERLEADARKLYMAMTRAAQQLFVVSSQSLPDRMRALFDEA